MEFLSFLFAGVRSETPLSFPSSLSLPFSLSPTTTRHHFIYYSYYYHRAVATWCTVCMHAHAEPNHQGSNRRADPSQTRLVKGTTHPSASTRKRDVERG